MTPDESMRESSARLASMFAEVERALGPNDWGRVELLVAELVGLYGEGFLRLLLAHALAQASDRGQS